MINVGLSLLPVLSFLIILYLLDNFKLVKSKLLFTALSWGTLSAIASFFVNTFLLNYSGLSFISYGRYFAPLIEEGFKILFLIYLVRTHRIGFFVDASIYGFAIGTGFALFENIYYLYSLTDVSLYVWLFRGFGTAMMHGTTMVLFGIIYKFLTDRSEYFIPSVILAFVIASLAHSFYNHFIFSPVLTLMLVLFFIFAVTVTVYHFSEKLLSNWLHTGLNDDMEIIRMMSGNHFKETKLGKYLAQLQNIFNKEILLDIYCYIQIYTELSIKAKAKLLLNEAGWEYTPSDNIKIMLSELKYLENNIGKAGLLALKPILRLSKRELWQISLIE